MGIGTVQRTIGVGTLSEAIVEAVHSKWQKCQEPSHPKEDQDAGLQTAVQGHTEGRGEGREERRGGEGGKGRRGREGRGRRGGDGRGGDGREEREGRGRR